MQPMMKGRNSHADLSMSPPSESAGNSTDPFPNAHYPHQALTHAIIGAFFDVHATLGYGFLESAYRRSMAVELAFRDIAVRQEVGYELLHRGVSVGFYRADLVAADSVIVEVKTGMTPDRTAPAQLLNYLRVSRLRVGLILHFGPRGSVKRVIASRGAREMVG